MVLLRSYSCELGKAGATLTKPLLEDSQSLQPNHRWNTKAYGSANPETV